MKLDFALCANGNLTRDEVNHKMSSGFYAMDVKLDGVRASIHAYRRAVTITTRGGMNVTNQFPYIADLFHNMEPSHEILLDGELVSYDFKFKSVQSAINSSKPTDNLINFHAFDMLMSPYHVDMKSMTWSQRRMLLEEFKSRHVLTTTVVERDPVEAMKLYDALPTALPAGEGVVLKHINKPYWPGRSDAWLRSKYKNTINLIPLQVYDNLTVDLMVYDFDKKEGILVGSVQMPDEDVFFLLQKDLNVIIEAEAYGVDSSTGKLRHLTYKGMRFDSDQSSCNIEQLDHFRNY